MGSSEQVSMKPYFHFDGGDHLYFSSWTPSSRGDIVGASVGLLLLSILERWLHATRAVMDARWRRSAFALSSTRGNGNDGSSSKKQETIEVNTQVEGIGSTRLSRGVRRIRTIPQFVLARDVARGTLYSLQATLSYALMLAVMTFQAAYIISIVIGLGLGEVLFGRLAGAYL